MNHTYTVTSLADNGAGSLRLALLSADLDPTPGLDTIVFSGNAAQGTILLESALPELVRPHLTIAGPAADKLTVERDSTARPFSLFHVASGAGVDISGLTLTGGDAGSSGEGGAILNEATLVLGSCTVTGNKASNGGGVANEPGCTFVTTNCTFSNNSAESSGGGVFNSGTAVVEGCTFSQNTSMLDGGGIINEKTFIGVDSTFYRNQANANGGGLAMEGTTATVVACTFAANLAGSAGPGIFSLPGTLILDSSLVAGNMLLPSSVSTAGGPADGGIGDITGFVAAKSAFNLVGDGTGLSGISSGDSGHNLVGTAAKPIDPDLGPLQNNGGPTFTMAPADGSPAIGAGDPSLGPSTDQPGLTDQAGNPRAIDGRVDAGAFEVQAKALQHVAITGLPQGSTPEGTSLTLGSNVLDIDPHDSLTYNWTVIDHGSGKQIASGSSPSLTFTPPYFGSDDVTLTVTDPYGESVRKFTAIQVSDVAPTVDLGGTAVLLTSADFSQNGSFTDPGLNTWTATVNYGDGAGTQPLALMGKTFTLSHHYAAGGTYTVTVDVSDGPQTGKATLAVTVPFLPQSINFAPLGPITFEPDFKLTLHATGGASGNAVDFSIDSSSTGMGAISGNVLTVMGAGDIIIDAEEPGNSKYAAAQAQQTLQVNKANASISVAPYTVTYDGAAHTATGTAVGLDGTDLTSELNLTGTTHTAPGCYPDTWTFQGDNNYNAATGNITDTIDQVGVMTITATAGPTVVIGANSPLIASATLANGLNPSGTLTFTLTDAGGTVVDTETVAVNGNRTYTTPSGFIPTLPGTYQWIASYGGDANNNSVSTSSGSTPEIAVGAGATMVGQTLYLVGGNGSDSVHVQHVGKGKTGATGIEILGRLDGVKLKHLIYQSAPTLIYFVGFKGNDSFSMESRLTTGVFVSEGGGNDTIRLGQGDNSVTVGSGRDLIQAGNAGAGGRVQITLGNGANSVTIANADAGRAKIQVGDGNNVIVAGSGNNVIVAGNGDNFISGGVRSNNIHAGHGSNILIDGYVSTSSAVLEQALEEWMTSGAAAAVAIRGQLAVAYNTTKANTLHAGRGLDWFWASYARDHLNAKANDLLN